MVKVEGNLQNMLAITANLICENLQTPSFDYMMKENFEKRTNFHRFLVQKYIDKIIALNDPRLDLAVLKSEKKFMIRVNLKNQNIYHISILIGNILWKIMGKNIIHQKKFKIR